jgi:hypothetical protein
VRLGGPLAARLLEMQLTQPDDFSCGAASSVVARALCDEGYTRLLLEGSSTAAGFPPAATPVARFRSETLAMHRRITGPVDVAGRLQLPWPSRTGTPPWAVAHQLSTGTVRYRSHLALGGLPVSRIRAAVAAGRPVPAYVGNRWAPRHVVLAVGTEDDGGLAVYDPARGRVVSLSVAETEQGSLPFGRWDRSWFVVLPED